MAIIKPINSFTKPFADTGAKNTIPDASLIGTTAGAASLSDGFPPLTMTPVAAGGVPPSGKDMNGILNQISQHTAWLNAGGNYQFDAAIAAAGGYPLGAIIYSNDWSAAYRNVLAGNTTNFNTTPTSIGVSWMPHGGAVLLQTQTATAFTTAGTAPTYTGSITPAPAALKAPLRVRAKFHASTTAASTLNLNAFGAKSIKQTGSTGALVDAVLFANQLADLEYDGTNWVVLDPVPYNKADAGLILYFATGSAPTGYLKANGSAVSRTAYANLFAAIGTTFGTGDGSTTFNLPDLRGQFPRGWDDGLGIDAGRIFGTTQEGTWLRTLAQEWTGSDTASGTYSIGNAYAQPDARINTPGVGGGFPVGAVAPSGGGYSNATTDNAIQGTAYVADQTSPINNWIRMRPSNVALLACIKY